ncbi:MAG: DUF4105 domain-containing protein, partial [Myxococcales bacterium]|nr:DUF4105 domain-containing protein [Myxococcales bacterium]
ALGKRRKDSLPAILLFCALVVGVLGGSTPTAAAQENKATGQENGAQRAAEDAPSPDALRVYLWTISPGDDISSLFGHTFLVVIDPARRSTVAYDFGLFQYGSDFVLQFLSGDMRFWGAPRDPEALIEKYKRQNRHVWSQELDLDPSEAEELYEQLRRSVSEEHKFYRYDYFLENCSTRVRDFLDRAVGGAIRSQSDAPSDTTWRFHVRRYTEPNALAYGGLHFLVGRPGDTPISKWNTMFLPLGLHDGITDVTVERADGSKRPLVRASRHILHADRAPPPGAPVPFHAVFAILGFGWAALMALGVRGRSHRFWRRFLQVTGAVFYGVAAIGGLLLTFILLTDHWAMHWNQNLALANPFAFIGLFGILRGSLPRFRMVLSAVAALGSAFWLLGPLAQDNLEWIVLLLPGHLVLAWAARRKALTRQSS